MKEKKYELTDDIIEPFYNCTMYRIKALKDFGDVKKGQLGGFVASEDNLSQDGNCWINHYAMVFGNAHIFGNAQLYVHAKVYGDAEIYGNAKVYGDAEVSGYAEICGDAEVKSVDDYSLFKNFWSSGRSFTWTKSNDMWKVGCFYGTGDELIKKAYDKSEENGKNYETTVNYVKQITNGKEI